MLRTSGPFTVERPPLPIRHRPRTRYPPETFGALQPADGSTPFPLPQGRLSSPDGLLVGRDARLCDVALGSAAVSRKHLRLRRAGDALVAEDLNSTDGTYVDGVPLQPFVPHPVSSGQTLTIGGERLLVRLHATGQGSDFGSSGDLTW